MITYPLGVCPATDSIASFQDKNIKSIFSEQFGRTQAFKLINYHDLKKY